MRRVLRSGKENLVNKPSALVPHTVPVHHRTSGGIGSVQSPDVAETVLDVLLGKGETLAARFVAKQRRLCCRSVGCVLCSPGVP